MVKQGEMIPNDGEVILASEIIAITGESLCYKRKQRPVILFP
ncbi:hypothetical protein CW304_02240 [Bacillus sp. UFRGS-B20]|nr:hypothetical protein CW304_02240 [Bacillus sp. UFRGS-B20]